LYGTNLFTFFTNAPFLKTDGDGKLAAGVTLEGTNVLLSAGANITFATNGDGTIVIAGNATNVVDTSTNNLIVVTNVIVYSNLYVLNNTFIVTNFSTNLYFVSGKGNTLVITNVYVAERGVLVNSNTAINSAVITDDKHAYTNAANAHGVFTNSATGPPSFGLLQNTEMQNSAITVQGAAVSLGGSTLAAGSTPAFGAINITNYNYVIATNNGGGNALVGGANGTAATLYITNITAATTLASFTWPTTVGSGIKMYVTCSGGTDRILTFPNGCTGAGLGTPPAVTITNAKAAYFDVLCIPGLSTNVFWSPVF